MKKICLFFMSLFLCFLFVSGVKAESAYTQKILNAQSDVENDADDSTIASHSGVSVGGAIPKAYSFAFGGKGKLMNVTSKVNKDTQGVIKRTYDAGWSSTPDDGIHQYFSDASNRGSVGDWACYSEIGSYNGKKIDAKGTVLNYAILDSTANSTTKTPIIAFPTVHKVDDNYYVPGAYRPGITALGPSYVKVKWSFTEHNASNPCGGAAVKNIKGHTTYSDIDWRQGIIFHDGRPVGSGGNRFYLVSSHADKLFLKSIDNTIDDASNVPYVFSSDAGHNGGKSFTEIFDTGDTNYITRTYTFIRPDGHGNGGIGQYANKAQVKLETPDPTKKVSNNSSVSGGKQNVNEIDITQEVKDNIDFTYTVTQEIPLQSSDYYYNSFVFSDTLENVLQASSLEVYDEDNTDVTNLFTVSLNQTITATLKNANNSDFYGHTYRFVVGAKVKSGDVESYRNGTVYRIPNRATVTYDGDGHNTNFVYVNYYRGLCPGGDCSDDPEGPEPELKPKKTVSTNFINDTTSFDYRVSQFVPGYYNADYLWTSLSLTDTIDPAFDMRKTKVKVISSRYGDRDLSSGADAMFDVTVNDHTITATAKASALENEDFYGPVATGTTYTMVITTQVTEGFDFTGYETTTDSSGDVIYTVKINNEADRTFKDKHGNVYTGKTNNVPTTQINPFIPSKYVDTEMIRYEHEFNYTVVHEVQPAGYIKSEGEATSEENQKLYYESYVFTDVLEAPLYIADASKVKIMQKDTATGNEVDYTDKFNISVEGNKITATAKADTLKNDDFYGTRGNNNTEILKEYHFIMTVALRDNAENIMDMSKYIGQDGVSYVIPNKGNITTKTPSNEPVSKDTNNVDVYYYPESDPVKLVNEENVSNLYKNNQEFTYTIKKDVLAYDERNYFESYVFEDTLEDCLQAPNSIVIKNEAGIDVTSWFDVKIEGQKITASLKNTKQDNFYGHTYSYIINAKVKQNYDLSRWKLGGQYVIPNYATYVIDNKVRLKTNIRDVYINIDSVVVNVPPTAAGLRLYTIIGIVIVTLVLVGYYLYIKFGKKIFNKK